MNSYASGTECCGCGRSGEQVWVQVLPENTAGYGLCQYCRLPDLEPPAVYEYALRRRAPPVLSVNPAQKREKELGRRAT